MMIYYLFLLLAQVMVAINVVGSKYLIPSMPILFLLAVRFTLATLFLLPLYWFNRGDATIRLYFEKMNKKDWIFILAEAVLAGVLFNALMLLGLNYTGANVAGIITSALPALIALLSFIVLKEKLSIKKSLSIALATFGLLAISAGEFTGSKMEHSLLGDVLIFFALLPEAGYYILSKLHLNKLPIFLIAALMNGINAIILLPIALMHENWQTLSFSAYQWSILFLISISSALFYVFWYSGSHKVDGVAASLSTALMPIATVTIAWLTLGELINFMQLIGMGLVMTSILAYTFS